MLSAFLRLLTTKSADGYAGVPCSKFLLSLPQSMRLLCKRVASFAVEHTCLASACFMVLVGQYSSELSLAGLGQWGNHNTSNWIDYCYNLDILE